jgi:hypothetical protein
MEAQDEIMGNEQWSMDNSLALERCIMICHASGRGIQFNLYSNGKDLDLYIFIIYN